MQWETANEIWEVGEYSFRVIVDQLNLVKELRDLNNMFPAPGDETLSEIVYLDEGCLCGDGKLAIESLFVSTHSVCVNEMVLIKHYRREYW
jgi:hypothetical protein